MFVQQRELVNLFVKRKYFIYDGSALLHYSGLTFTLHLPNQIRNAQIRMYKNKWQLQKMNYGVSYVMSSNFIFSESHREKTWLKCHEKGLSFVTTQTCNTVSSIDCKPGRMRTNQNHVFLVS